MEINKKYSKNIKNKTENLYLAGGCFWCIEAIFNDIPGIISTTSGYANGDTLNPSYEDVCEGNTNFAEVVKVQFDPSIIKLEDLLEIFFISHDPTQLNKQGVDIGTQYRSAIFYINNKQKEEAINYIKKLEKQFNKKIVTQIEELENFYTAEEYHKNYFANNPENQYCSLVIAPKIKEVKNKLLKLKN